MTIIVSTHVIHYLSSLIQLMVTHWLITNSTLYINILLHSYNSPGFKDALLSSVVVVSSLTIAPSVVLLSSYNHIRNSSLYPAQNVMHVTYMLLALYMHV